LRLSYNDGDLEIMITKFPHEFYKKMLAKIVDTTIMELELPVRSGGSMTFQINWPLWASEKYGVTTSDVCGSASCSRMAGTKSWTPAWHFRLELNLLLLPVQAGR
jgi:hypothetical protein